jgi:hypothetical protein
MGCGASAGILGKQDSVRRVVGFHEITLDEDADKDKRFSQMVLSDPELSSCILQKEDMTDREHIGSGTHGEVYRAMYQSFHCAVKTLHVKMITEIQLIELVSSIKDLYHRNVVRFIGGQYIPFLSGLLFTQVQSILCSHGITFGIGV